MIYTATNCTGQPQNCTRSRCLFPDCQGEPEKPKQECIKKFANCLGPDNCALVDTSCFKDPQKSMIERALSQPTQKDDANQLLAQALKLHAIMFHTFCNETDPNFNTFTHDKLYDLFLVSLQSGQTGK